jgi:hypothetical protein
MAALHGVSLHKIGKPQGGARYINTINKREIVVIAAMINVKLRAFPHDPPALRALLPAKLLFHGEGGLIS